MRKAFTLIELLVVVAVLAALMAIMFRLAGVTGEHENRAQTIKRIQAVENCLSGYYAAFGCYPPVKVHGTRSIHAKVDEWGVQSKDGETSGGLNWNSVNAACRAQPVGVMYPFADSPGTIAYYRGVAEELNRRATSDASEEPEFKSFRNNAAVLSRGFDILEDPAGQIPYPEAEDWRQTQLFQFGLLSFLLPRYHFMTLGDPSLYGGRYKQWNANNESQKQCHGDGRSTYGWNDIRNDMRNGKSAYVSMIPSQAACARWMPNLEGVIDNGRTFFGINTHRPLSGSPVNIENPYPPIFSGNGRQYVLDSMTVVDGWGRDLYYYSPVPYQTYRLWSAGPNGKTFPPWVELSSLGGGDRTTAAGWIADDIVSLRN